MKPGQGITPTQEVVVATDDLTPHERRIVLDALKCYLDATILRKQTRDTILVIWNKLDHD